VRHMMKRKRTDEEKPSVPAHTDPFGHESEARHFRERKKDKKDLSPIQAKTIASIMKGTKRLEKNKAKERSVGLAEGQVLSETMEGAEMLLGECTECGTETDVVECVHCENKACARHARQCHLCHLFFCSLCSLPNFDQPEDRSFCLSCDEEEKKRAAASDDQT